MKKNLLGIILLTLILLCFLPTLAFADSISGGILTLDSSGGNLAAGTLQTRAEAQVGAGNGPTTITELIVTATGTFDATDIAYINTLVNLEVLNVATSITVGDVGDNFCYIYSTTAFENLREVTFPATTFGDYALSWCDALTDVSLPNAIDFGAHAFRDSSLLTSISLPSATTFGGRNFSGCSSLTSISLPSATTFEGGAFFNSGLTSITLFKTTTFGYEAFEQCFALTTVNLPSTTDFGDNAFYDCTSLTSISLPNAITFGWDAFNTCTSLTSISLPSAVSFGNFAFHDCTSLTSLSLPSTTSFGTDTFNNSTSLTSLTLGETVPTVISWGANLPATMKVYVPLASLSLYDPDGDGLWEGFTVVGIETSAIVVSNPQTGEVCWFNHVIEWVKSLF